MTSQYEVDDSNRLEVVAINGYAVFMAFLMMGVRGLGILVVTWTTVVLLGGFVSDLQKKDFWCLTGIMLVQTAGVLNLDSMEKLKVVVLSWWRLLRTVFVNVRYDFQGRNKAMAYILALQRLVLGIILYPLAVLYLLGFYVSAGVSLWRLIEHDFGDTGGANQKPALQVLYTLTVVQGVLFCCKTMNGFVSRTRLAQVVAEVARVDQELVAKYLEETVAGCEKDPSFASGRNFVTYGVDLLMEAKSSEDFIAGIKVLGYATDDESGAKVLAKYHLTREEYWEAIIGRLLLTAGGTSPYITEMVLCIVDSIAGCISLKQFPGVIEDLCSAVDTSEESNNKLQLQGNHTDESRGYGTLMNREEPHLCSVVDTSEDYERVELLEEYENIKSEHRFASPDSSFLKCLYQRLIQHCFQAKRKTVGNKRKKHIIIVKAVNIIHKLVANNKDKTKILRAYNKHKTVLYKIARFPIKLHRDNHDPFGVYEKSELQMLEQCWVLTEWLLVDLTETSNPLFSQPATPVGEGRPRNRSEEIEEEVEEWKELHLVESMDGSALVSKIKRTIKDSIGSAIKCIFDCLYCRATQKRQAIQILLHLSLDMSFIIKDSESSRRRLSWILLLILCSTDDDSEYWMVPSLTYPNNNCCDFDGIRRLAGEKLYYMLREKHELPSEETATGSQLVGLAIGDLKSAFYDVAEDISIRTHAIIIMEGLCRVRYTHFSEVEEFLISAIPEVVKETLIRCGSKTAERQEQATDVEKGNVSQDNQDGCIDTKRLRKALVSLCYGYKMNSSSTMRSKFKEIASQICKEQEKSFE